MNLLVRVPLQASPEQQQRLIALQQAFARVCNVLAPQVQMTRVWNRVTLHHLYYRELRARFPALGSQMVCNAIYAVSKMARLVYQHPDSPYNISRRPQSVLPLLKFADTCPVYFDRHTLSIRPGSLSLFTMDGRMHFHLDLPAEQLQLFEEARLREVVLALSSDQLFQLSFYLLHESATKNAQSEQVDDEEFAPSTVHSNSIPEYISIEVP